jgi:glutaredoxin-like protein NrdH
MDKKVFLYALSTCGWCRKTKRFLDENKIDYDFIDVDLLSSAEREQVERELAKYNPRRSFPTVVVDGKDVVVGFDEDRLHEVCGR